MDDFKCKIEVIPVAKWVKDPKTESCPSCLIAPLSSYYLNKLEEVGEEKLVAELKELFAQGDILTISKKLDSIKVNVGEALRKQLLNLDCFAQTFKG